MSDIDPDDMDGASARLLEESPRSSRPVMEQRTAEESEDPPSLASRTSIRRLLYTSHFLSAWNSRAFEFGAFLFLATIYPQTLLPASIYALTRAGAAAILTPRLGGYIDHSDRLSVVRLSIVGQRIAVAASCIVLYCLCQFEEMRGRAAWTYSALALLSVLACVEKLAAVTNTIAVERDWVVVIANDNEDHLRTMNSQMRRIDLFCKLIAPLFISLVDSSSSKLAIVVTGAMTVLSVFVEYFAIARVHTAVPTLQAPKSVQRPRTNQDNFAKLLLVTLKASVANTAAYFGHRAFLPSFSLALLYLTVLSFNGQMVTYLVAIGFNSAVIGVLRGVSAIFELSATWIAPKLMHRIGPVRSGIWFINWEIFCVSIACMLFWLTEHNLNGLAAAGGIVTAVIVSRVGLWGFDLSAQIIIQEEVESELRGMFSSQEFAAQNIFEMLSFASTIIFSRPEQFKIPATISTGAVAAAGILYAAFVRSRRGHLVHLSRCMERAGKIHTTAWQHLPQEDEDDRGSQEHTPSSA